MKKTKICFIASSGGHFAELKSLAPVAREFDSFLVTEKVKNFKTDFCDKCYLVRQINRREKFFLFNAGMLFLKELFIFIKERPSVVVTTGALCSYPMMKIAKFFRKKVVYIESYARVDELSMTGKKAYNIADKFLVQWPELADKYDKAEYVGSVFGGEQ